MIIILFVRYHYLIISTINTSINYRRAIAAMNENELRSKYEYTEWDKCLAVCIGTPKTECTFCADTKELEIQMAARVRRKERRR